jgi:hypothetical protein
MDRISMADIIPLLALPYPPHGKSAFYTPCPKCDKFGKQKDKHLNINIAKNVFRCARCGINGGIFDLYALFTGIQRNKVRNELMRILGGGASGIKQTVSSAPPATQIIVETPVADINIRHAVYSSLLSMLTLAPDHKQNLLGRGLSECAITEKEYRTTPVIGAKALATQLQGKGLHLGGVPGFYTDYNGHWSFIHIRRGIIIPVRDIQGRIQGLQVRLDNQHKRKYRWISSAEVDGGANGCKAEGWIHLAGQISERIILTEGPLKADIVHHLTGRTVLAVPGVNSLKHLERVLCELHEFGVSHIMTAFDMDFIKNPHVQNGYNELVKLLERLNLRFGTYLWNPDYTGLDDYVLHEIGGCS